MSAGRSGRRAGRRTRVTAAVLGALALTGAGTGEARAQGLALEDCRVGGVAARCGTLTVPLDHSGRIPGTQRLALALVPARGERRGTLAVVPGGPGQPAVELAPFVLPSLGGASRNHDVLFVDPRGTGESDPADCPDPTSAEDVAACGERLGPRRAFLTSPEQSRDLEDVRQALGIPQLSLYGVSYGTIVAAEYVRRFPASTARVVLDSPAPVDGLDAEFRLRSFALPRVLREVCYPPSCRGFLGDDPVAAVAELARRLERRAVRATAITPAGRRRSTRLGAAELYTLFALSDLDPFLRADLPAAVASGLNGDTARFGRLLLQLSALAEETGGVNVGRFLATACIESRLPWRPDSPVAGREAALLAELESAGTAFAPFSAATVLPLSIAGQCLTWPSTPAPERVARPAPAVPTLVIAGRDDLRTPVEDARRTAGDYPNVRLLNVPDVGHSVIGNDLSGCAQRGLSAFLAGREVANCRRGPRPLDVAPYIPASVDDLATVRGLSRRAGRTVTAVRATLLDVERETFRALLLSPRRSVRVGGLRAGTLRAVRRGSGFALASATLDGFSVVRGVRVSGRIARRTASLRVTGSQAATGALRLARGRITGTLGGERVSVRLR